MRIAFVGKGGSGKTTITGLFAKYLASKNKKILVIDADINQHLGSSLGFEDTKLIDEKTLGNNIDWIKDFFRNRNSLIGSSKEMIKTTPPGEGSRLINLESKEFFDKFELKNNGIRLLRVGGFSEQDIGTKCYHSKTGTLELLFNHLIDSKDDYILVDMTAGADSFASGLFTKFDMTLIVVEPTKKSIDVYKQYKEYAKIHDLKIVALGNKIYNKEEADYISYQIGEEPIAKIRSSEYIKKSERGINHGINLLEEGNLEALSKVLKEVDKIEKNWYVHYELAAKYHEKNAVSWGNDSVGKDLTKQIDYEFLRNIQKMKGGQNVISIN
ncbi:ATP-binding protein [Candidatus Pacearchaeota archaeon]|nr:ATP-binding protein [Candidatus Pacearchaeota archaeon]